MAPTPLPAREQQSHRVHQFHTGTVTSAVEIMASMGLAVLLKSLRVDVELFGGQSGALHPRRDLLECDVASEIR